MRILLYGDFSTNQLSRSYQSAFEELGTAVIPLDRRLAGEHLAPWLSNRYLHRLTINSLALRRSGAKKWNETILSTVENSKPDLFLALSGDFLMPETIQQIKQLGVKAFQFYADNPFPQHARSRPETLPQALAADAYFIWSHALAQRLQDFGVNNVHYLPFAWDPAVFPYVEPEARWDYDLTFIGGWDKERETLLEGLAEQYDVKIWGPPYWKTRTRQGSPLRQCWQGRSLYSDEAGQVARRSRISLNLLRAQNMPDGVNMRTFELPGCGAFALSTFSAGAAEIFPEGTVGAFFSTLESCAAQIDYFLSRDALRAEITAAAHAIVAEKHRYVHRAQSILDAYQSLDG